jgi:NADH-ubiquinone oxidoreductase chain 2
MLTLALFILLTAVALPSVYATPALLTRVTVLTFLSAAALAANAYSWEGVGSGLGLYSGLIDLTGLSLAAQVFLLSVGAIALVQWAPHAHLSPMATPRIATYPLFALLSSMGGCLLVASGDMVTLYLALELQSFAVYVLAALYRDSESATRSGLLYFLLGGLSSCLILLGFAVVYNQTGITNLESLVTLLSVGGSDSISINWALALGFTAVMTGLLFKVTAAPFHNWGPDVYDGVPTIVTTWIAVLPKISLLTLLYTLSSGLISAMLVVVDTASYDVWALLLLMSSTLSLVVGAVVGLAQRRIKRLLAYSTVSHVGFMLLAISVNSPEATSAFVFYLVQYTLTAMLSFSLLGAISHSSSRGGDITHDVSLISQLAGLRVRNLPLAFSLLVLLFSLAGVPPLLGFFGKLEVLYSAISGGYYFVSLVAILSSVISASYYLNVIRVAWFDPSAPVSPQVFPHDHFANSLTPGGVGDYYWAVTRNSEKPVEITAVQSYTISLLTAILVFYMASPSLLLDSARLLALSLFSV